MARSLAQRASHRAIPRPRLALPGAAAAALLLAPRAASAYDVLAAPCDDDPLRCERGALHFERKDALPIEFDFDTGWVPQGSPLEVHLWAALLAHTTVSLRGALETSWPDALLLATPGDMGGGAFDYHDGLDVGAQGKVNITVAGHTYTWTGDIPYVPQIDFEVHADRQFDAWAFPPGVSMSSSTQQTRLATVSVGDLIGASIPGIDGGFELDVALEVAARYETQRLVLAQPGGVPVSGGDILSADQSSQTRYLGGPAVELDVHPEGSVKYDGTLHLIPAFYVSLLGQHWSIPVVDIPLGFPITERPWAFDDKRVHVPLPDLVLPKREIDFGRVEVGQKHLVTYALHDAGEAPVAASIVADDPRDFEVFEPMLTVEPAATVDSALRFVPKQNGELTATVYVASNDPSDPVQTIVLHGVGYGAPDDEAPTPAPPRAHDPVQEGACACRTAGGGAGRAAQAAWTAGAAIAALGWRSRRRRPRAAQAHVRPRSAPDRELPATLHSALQKRNRTLRSNAASPR